MTNRPLTVIAVMLGLFMAAMEMTVVSTAMPTVIADLGGIELYAWVFTAYMLASTVSVPIYGKAADLYGRKPIMLFGTALFLLGSILSGQARSMVALIAFRSLQGLGAGAMQPTALTIIGDIFNLEERAKMQGLFGAVWGFSGLVGPLLGGIIVRALSWRWVFYVNVPFGLASAALLAVALREKVEKKPHRLDLAGAAVLTIAILGLLAAAHGTWLAVTVPASVGLLWLFVVVERRAAEPMLPVDLFRQRVIAVSSVAGALVGGAMIATVTFVPLFVQAVLGGSPTDAGGAITPMVIAWPLASAISGRLLPRIGFRPMVRLGFFLAAAASLALALLLVPGVGLGVPRATTALFGVGMGFANTALIIAVQSSVSWERRGTATASTMFFRSIGGALAVGAMGGVLASSLDGAAGVPHEVANRLFGPEHGAGIEPAILARLSVALGEGLGMVFWMIAGLSVVAFVVSLSFPRQAGPAAAAEAPAEPSG